MPLKRASRGRRKGGKGSSDRIQCINCGATVPKDKAKKLDSYSYQMINSYSVGMKFMYPIYCVSRKH